MYIYIVYTATCSVSQSVERVGTDGEKEEIEEGEGGRERGRGGG